MLRCQFLCHVLKALFFIKIALKLSYFCKKMQIFRALGLRPQSPVPPAAGGFAPRPPNSPPPLRISGYAPVLCHDNGMTVAERKYHTVSLLNCDVFRIF